MDEKTKLRHVRTLHSQAGPNKKFLGPRPIFEKADDRFVEMQNNVPLAFLEVLYMTDRKSAYLNFGYKRRLTQPQVLFSNLLNEWRESDIPKTVKNMYISAHLGDKESQDMYANLGFTVVSERSILVRYRFPTDGVHITYHSEV